ncbi:MAG: S9 family peptidase [Holophagae bacterium]|nr:MAG: S9 family peptidase [Holophagae bacterium]
MRQALILLAAAALLLGATAAEPVDPPARDHGITVDDYFTIANILEVAVSPDGRTAAFIENRWEPPAEERNADLWTVDLADRTLHRLTFDDAAEGSPAWSPDGRFIYYAADYLRDGSQSPPWDGSTQVWRIAAAGGEPQAVTRIVDGIAHFRLARDGRSLIYAVGFEQTDDEWKALREEFDELEYGHGVTTFTELWTLDLESWRSTKLVDATRVVTATDVAADGRIAMITTPDEEQIHDEGWSRVDVWDPTTRQITVVTADGWRAAHPSPFGWINEVAWSDDGELLAFSVSFDGYPTLLYAAVRSDAGYRLLELPRPDGVEVTGGSLAWRPGSHDLCFIGDHRARGRVYAVRDVSAGGATGTSVVTPGDVTVDGFDFDATGGTPVVITSTLTDPPDLYRVADGGALERLTRVNPQVDTWKLPSIELVQWASTDGTSVEGILELPPGHTRADGPLPLVVELHGGPTDATRYQLQYWIYGRTLMPAQGYALLSPNYRGSTGYGDRFLVELVGRENDIDVQDILSGVDAMIERGIADPERLAVMGWSNGGFLTNCLITTTRRFKAASSGAGVIDQVLQWGIEDTPGHVINYMDGQLPWAGADTYREGSPLYRLGEVRTPTLIHVGGDDPRVPAAHSRTLYRALKHYLGVPAELVIYPGEGHGLSTYEHRRAKMEWDLAWFAKYLQREPAASE